MCKVDLLYSLTQSHPFLHVSNFSCKAQNSEEHVCFEQIIDISDFDLTKCFF
jgi:hypothetical protein